jgi:hypothetical protein
MRICPPKACPSTLFRTSNFFEELIKIRTTDATNNKYKCSISPKEAHGQLIGSTIHHPKKLGIFDKTEKVRADGFY